ncbi:g10658 [Coccomyxa viridis]|uniref:G10658 protein n=1 Tax=Coccomyxa viridis TaxID=1274662 RepID=A0ABP1G6B0_9CHLO
MRRVVILVVFITGLSIASASPQEELAQHTAASGSAEQAPNAGKKRRHAADSQDGTHLPGSTGASEADKVEL